MKGRVGTSTIMDQAAKPLILPKLTKRQRAAYKELSRQTAKLPTPKKVYVSKVRANRSPGHRQNCDCSKCRGRA